MNTDPQPGEPRERKPEYPPFDSAPVEWREGGVREAAEIKDLQSREDVET